MHRHGEIYGCFNWARQRKHVVSADDKQSQYEQVGIKTYSRWEKIRNIQYLTIYEAICSHVCVVCVSPENRKTKQWRNITVWLKRWWKVSSANVHVWRSVAELSIRQIKPTNSQKKTTQPDKPTHRHTILQEDVALSSLVWIHTHRSGACASGLWVAWA